MTATEVQDHARVLSNSSWCRYWLLWGIDSEGCNVAIQCRDETGKPLRIADATTRGYNEHPDYLYMAPRTNEDGTYYIPKEL